jgi:hypothetical protein
VKFRSLAIEVPANSCAAQGHLTFRPEWYSQLDRATDLQPVGVERYRPGVENVCTIADEITTDGRAAKTYLAYGLEVITKKDWAFHVQTVSMNSYRVRPSHRKKLQAGVSQMNRGREGASIKK